MKNRNLKKGLYTLALFFTSSLIVAQDYDLIHLFNTNYDRSAHTCAVQLNASKVIQGGTVDNSMFTEKVVELSVLDPSDGKILLTPTTYGYTGLSHTAADLTESLGDPGRVVCAANMSSGTSVTNNMVNIFKADAANGTVDWSILYKSGNGPQSARAMTSDGQKSYYVIGNANFGSNQIIYLIKIKDDGTPLWERYYSTNTRALELEGVDVVFDGNHVVIVGNVYSTISFPNGQGVMIALINPLDGSVVGANRLTKLHNSSNFQAKDLELIGGEYAFVGEFNQPPSPIFVPKYGFMVKYNSLLNVSATRLYAHPSGYDLVATGIKPELGSGMYISMDVKTGTFSYPIPGIMHTDAIGAVLSSEVYKLDGYLGSDGLIGTNGMTSYMIKGSTDLTAIAPGLSVIGQSVPLASNEKTCGKLFEVKNDKVKYDSPLFFIDVKKDETANKIELVVDEAKGLSFDCNGNNVAQFRLQRPEMAADEQITADFHIFPNPSNGNISIRFNDGDVAAYQTGEVINLLGEVVATFNITNVNTPVNLSSEAAGIYMVRLKSTSGEISEAKRIVIK